MFYNANVDKKHTLQNEKGDLVMNKKDILKGVLISIITLVAGYVAMIVPFKLFLSVSKDGQRIFFIIERETSISIITICCKFCKYC